MYRLRLQFLGSFQVWVDDEPCDGFRSNRARAMLAFLAVESGRAHARSSLAGSFWPDLPEADALHNLRQTLVRIRQAIKDEQIDAPHLLITRQSVQFNQASSFKLDVSEFETLAENGLLPLRKAGKGAFKLDTALLEQALLLYQGEFLKGYSFPESYAFDEWLLFKREHLHRLALEVMYTLAAFYLEKHNYSLALQHARRQLELDSWREEAHRQVMLALFRMGQRSAALAQYEICRKFLSAELGVQPEPETEALYAQIKAGIPIQAASPASRPQSQPSTLPVPLTPFIGRDQELTQLVELLKQPTTRLITLMGEGGIGKTRLALAAGNLMRTEMEDGVWYVSLAEGVENFKDAAPALVNAISSALGLFFYSKNEPRTQLINFLHSRCLLLILDNFEHLISGADFVLELLQAAPNLKLIVTSRERLNVQAEHTYRLKGLPVPAVGDADARQASSVQLFEERARRAWHEFTLSDSVLQDVIKVCQLVEGLPLAIELAAARSDQMNTAEIGAAIQQNIDFLTTSLRDLPARHRSLRAVLEASWRALSHDLRLVLAQCAVFTGSFDVEAATAVIQADEAPEKKLELADLEKLLSQSLLRRVNTPLASVRFDLHVLVRQFAAGKLQNLFSDQGKTLQARFARYYVRFVVQRGAGLHSSQQKKALAEIEVEIENIRQAWFILLDNSDIEQIQQLAPGLMDYYDLRGWYAEGWQMFTRARLPIQAAHFSLRLGNFDQARDLLTAGLAELTSAGDPRLKANCLYDLSSLAINLGNLAPGLEYAQQALGLYQAVEDMDSAANVLSNMGRIFAAQGEYNLSQQSYQRALDLRRVIGAPSALSDSLNSLGLLDIRIGDYVSAERSLDEALQYKRELDQQPGIADVLSNLGLVYMEQNRLLPAKAAMQEALDIHMRIGDRESLGIVLNNLGDIANQMGDYPEAINCLEASLQIKKEMHNRRGMTFSLIHLGHAYFGLGNLAEALRCQREALITATSITFVPLQLAALVGIAQILHATNQSQKAFEITQQVIGHPAVWKRTEREAQEISAQALAVLTPEEAELVRSTNQSGTLNELTADLLNSYL